MTPLPASLASLSASLSHLSTALSHLDACTADLPRLRRTLTLHPHFALLPAARLSAAQARLSAEIAPEIEALLRTVEAVVARREGRVEWLRSRKGLYEGRLGGGEEEEEERGERRAQAVRLRQKRERLGYAVERLTLQAGQRERQLRMSVAAQGVAGEEEEEGDEGDSGF